MTYAHTFIDRSAAGRALRGIWSMRGQLFCPTSSRVHFSLSSLSLSLSLSLFLSLSLSHSLSLSLSLFLSLSVRPSHTKPQSMTAATASPYGRPADRSVGATQAAGWLADQDVLKVKLRRTTTSMLLRSSVSPSLPALSPARLTCMGLPERSRGIHGV